MFLVKSNPIVVIFIWVTPLFCSTSDDDCVLWCNLTPGAGAIYSVHFEALLLKNSELNSVIYSFLR